MRAVRLHVKSRQADNEFVQFWLFIGHESDFKSHKSWRTLCISGKSSPYDNTYSLNFVSSKLMTLKSCSQVTFELKLETTNRTNSNIMNGQLNQHFRKVGA